MFIRTFPSIVLFIAVSTGFATLAAGQSDAAVSKNASAKSVSTSHGSLDGSPEPTTASSKADHDESAEKSIRAVLDMQVAAWNRGDLEKYMSGYWQSSDLTFFSGAAETHGWKETLDRYRKAYKTGDKKMGTLTFVNLRVDMLSSDAALVRGSWSLKMSNGTKPNGVFTLIFRKRPEGWRIVHDHSSGS